MRFLIYFVICCHGILALACTSKQVKKNPVESVPGYDFSTYETIKLPQELNEISGMAYHDSSNNILAINDEEGKIYTISLEKGNKIQHKRFTKGGDFEDLCLVQREVWALKSNGTLFHISGDLTDSPTVEKFEFTHTGKVDFETLVHLPQQQALLLICKQCAVSPNEVTGFYFDLNKNRFSDTPAFKLNVSQLSAEKALNAKSPIFPSAAAFHPVTGELYILASANRLLILADKDGYAKNWFALDQKTFKQPEGICFSPGGDLFVSNEARSGTANIRRFNFTPRQ